MTSPQGSRLPHSCGGRLLHSLEGCPGTGPTCQGGGRTDDLANLYLGERAIIKRAEKAIVPIDEDVANEILDPEVASAPETGSLGSLCLPPARCIGSFLLAWGWGTGRPYPRALDTNITGALFLHMIVGCSSENDGHGQSD